MQTLDYLIVGQGLAGSMLAWELIQRNFQVLVVDQGQTNASLIAAGLINPVTGMRLVKTQNIEQLLPAALKFYQHLSQQFQQPFYQEKAMLRIIRNQNEQEFCKHRLQQQAYQPYLEQFQLNQADFPCNTPFGILVQKQTGFLRCKSLLDTLKKSFIDRECLIQEAFNYLDLHITNRKISWKNFTFNQVIFCEGYQCQNNPWFSWLPLQPVKGEILTLHSSTPLPDKILNYGHWLVPFDATTIRTGATFDRENIDCQPSATGKQTLLTSLKKIMPDIEVNATVLHQAQIRPCTLDKAPFIGHHPQIPQLAIFNGFGAKGSLQIPWHVQHFADHLLYQTPLAKDVDINRYPRPNACT